MNTNRIKIVGLGGIGTCLLDPLCRFLSCLKEYTEVTIIDGDSYEERNRERQQFTRLGNKASISADALKTKFPQINFRSKSEYLVEDNVVSNVREGDIVFLCVDNHATRKLVSDRCEELDNVTLISGGNDYTDGNVIYYARKNGEDVGRPPTKIHPEIANPKDQNPGERTNLGCEEQARTSPQLLFTNNTIASVMCNVYYTHRNGPVTFEQVYVDILTQKIRPSPERF